MRSARPALVLLIVLLVLFGALSAANRDSGTRTRSTPAPGTVTTPVPEAGQVTATLPADRPVRVKVGDAVVLRVRSATPDIAEILQVGARAPVGPGLPGILQFIAQVPGDLAVTLELANRPVGVVRVESAPG